MKLWVVRAGSRGEQEKTCLNENLVTIGWDELPDLKQFDSKEKLFQKHQEIYNETNKIAANSAVGQIWRFVNEIEIGDLIALPSKFTPVIYVGTIESAYQYQAQKDALHWRAVKWLKTIPRRSFSQDILYSFGSLLTVFQVSRDNSAEKVLNLLQEQETIEQTLGEDTDIIAPFDPSQINIRTEQEALQNIISRLEYDEINIATEFQRKSDLWDDTKQSRLIESILLRLPLPSFYFDGTEDNKWGVVDGLQRISAIRDFVVKSKRNERDALKLTNLEFLKNLEGKKYTDLPRDLQRRIESFKITIYIIEQGTPPEVKYNIFKRINTGGLVLEPQEIRHALHQGIPAKFIEDLANLEQFKLATDNSILSDRMLDREFVNRFLAFYILPLAEYSSDLDSFMSKALANIPKDETSRLVIKNNFIQAMELAYTIFGNDAFRKRFRAEDLARKPINKALFDCISVCFARLSTEQAQQLKERKEVFKQEFIESMNNARFYTSISNSTNAKENVAVRLTHITNIIETVLNNDN